MKTKLGISAGLLSAIIYLGAYFGGYIFLAIVVGYVLLVEKNDWLSYVGVKAFCTAFAFSLLSVVIGLIPDVLAILSNIVDVFNGTFSYWAIINLESALSGILSIVKIVTFAMLAYKAITMQNFTVPVVDKIVEKFQ